MGWLQHWRERRRERRAAIEAREGHLPTARAANRLLGVATFFGLLCIVLYVWQAPSVSSGLSIAGVALLIAASAAAVGGFLGFLFAVPRAASRIGRTPSVSESARTAADAAKAAMNSGSLGEPTVAAATASAVAAAVAAQDEQSTSGVNSNLSDVSDWLTKILVGVGLTQIANVGPAFGDLTGVLAPSLGNLAGSQAVAGATLVLFLTVGFLAAYLETRLVLQRAMMIADGGSPTRMASPV